jgi:hypothetical protein
VDANLEVIAEAYDGLIDVTAAVAGATAGAGVRSEALEGARA